MLSAKAKAYLSSFGMVDPAEGVEDAYALDTIAGKEGDGGHSQATG